MVRLKVRINNVTSPVYNISIPVWCDWKQAGDVPLFCANLNFNSSMVRLKVVPPANGRYGCVISIPVWCDWKVIEKMFYPCLATISIPVWCDWKWQRHTMNAIMSMISIPVWCDWKIVNKFVVLLHVLFQFQYGAIESCYWLQSVI